MSVTAARRLVATTARPTVSSAYRSFHAAPSTLAKYIGNDGMMNYSLIDHKGLTPSVPRDAKPFLGSNLILKWMEGIKLYGLQRTFVQSYTLGDIKFGELVGVDVNGNGYYENMDYPHGQHRWVEYADAHNYDASSIPPEWHGWTTHMQDAPGSDAREYIDEKLKTKLEIDKGDHSVYEHHVGHTEYKMESLLNYTSHRKRGYKIGGIKQLPDEEDKFHVHAGHRLQKNKKGRFEQQKGMDFWDPSDPEGANTKPPNRSLDVN